MAEVQDKVLHQSSSKEVRGQSMLTVSPTVSPAEVYRIKLFIIIDFLLLFFFPGLLDPEDILDIEDI